MKLSVQEITAALRERVGGAVAVYGDVATDICVTAVCRDTRDVVAGSLFVCVQGARHDGHDFAAEAVRLGAVALLVSRRLDDVMVPQICVSDTVRALGALASYWRERFMGRVVVITGSAGKTTCKDVLADVLTLAISSGADGADGAGVSVARTLGNFNNQVGLPLSILATSGDEDVWVLEAGISEPQDMDELGAIVRPDVAVVLNVGMAHTQGLGERGVAWHKAQLVKYVRHGGTAFVNADYADLCAAALEALGAGVCLSFFSAKKNGAFECASPLMTPVFRAYFSHSQATGDGGVYVLTCADRQESWSVQAPFVGEYGSEHVSAVASVAYVLGISMDTMRLAFAQARLPQQRFEEHRRGVWRIIDDSYNANPLSMHCMLEAAMARSATKTGDASPCYAVLGSMAELGAEAESAHKELGDFLACMGAGQGIAHIFWKGAYALEVREAFVGAGGSEERFTAVESVKDFAAAWTAAALPSGTVLCKGSRSQRIEECVTWLLDNVAVKCREHVIPSM